MQRIPLRHTMALLLLAATLFVLAGPSQAQTVEYPVLVYSTSRGQHDVPATIHVTNASQAVSLCVTTHQAGYHMGDYIWANWNRRDDAAGLRLNGGNVVTDWNSTGTVDYPADHYEGVGGAYHTVRTCFPVNGGSGSLGAVQEGANTVSFRFYGVRDLARSGYRVIDIDVENAAGTDLITSEVHDDPELWTITNTVGAATTPPIPSRQDKPFGRRGTASGDRRHDGHRRVVLGLPRLLRLRPEIFQLRVRRDRG